MMAEQGDTLTRYYIAAISKKHPGTWERCKELSSWGSPTRTNLLAGVKPNDQLLIWQGGQGFIASARITSHLRTVETTPENDWQHPGRTYPYRFSFEQTR